MNRYRIACGKNPAYKLPSKHYQAELVLAVTLRRYSWSQRSA
jgi:hypothetical protein